MISQCEITKIEKKMFDELPMLEKLMINNNKDLRIIEEDAFSNLTQLVYLYLNKNRIESLGAWTFFELANLNHLDLSYNQLESIDENLFSGQQNLKTLYLRGNRLTDEILEGITVELDYFSF
jgi:Leucine-rich repeat (LRR) protein